MDWKQLKGRLKSLQYKYEDKLLHFTVASILAILTVGHGGVWNILAIVGVLGLILGKEFIDKDTTGFDYVDVIWGVGGMLFGIFVLIIRFNLELI